MSIEKTSTFVVAEFDAALDAYDYAREQDRLNAAMKAGDGSTVSFNDKFNDSYYEDQANSGIHAARHRALDEIDKALAARQSDLTRSPSEEAARYAASISGRDNLTLDETKAALAKYTDHATQKAILAAANRSGLYVSDMTETERDIIDLRNMSAEVNRRFTPYTIGSMSNGGRMVVKQQFMVR